MHQTGVPFPLRASCLSRPYNYGFSPFSRQVAASVNPVAIVEKRRRNYLALDKALSGSPGYLKVFNRLLPDTCPLFLPLWVARRDVLMAELRAKGVETFRFGATPHPKLDIELRSETAHLRDNILCLPVHDQIIVSDVERIADDCKAPSASARSPAGKAYFGLILLRRGP